MTRPRTPLLMALSLVCASCAGGMSGTAKAPTVAAAQPETEESHADKPNKVVTITPTRLVPDTLKMGTGDVLVFHNFSGNTMRLTFIQPKHVGRYTTCTLLKRVSPTEATAPGAVFQRQDDEVTATFLPGTFVSVCSLKPGTYVYVSKPVLQGALPNDATLGLQGTIVVE
jgi:plastocyanin